MKLSLVIRLWLLVSITLFDASARAADDIIDDLGPMDPKVIGAPVVDPKQFESVVNLSFPGSGCTGTLMSENVLITAGHCVLRSLRGSFNFKGKRRQFSCRAHPRYNPRNNHSLDMAACVVTEKLPIEKTACVGEKADRGDNVTIFGFGKTNGGRYDGRLRKGDTTVRGRSRTGDVVTSGRAALGSGDSGGMLAKIKNGILFMVGVNSKGDGFHSLYADAASQENRQFLTQFASNNKVKICGITNQPGRGTPTTEEGSRDLAANDPAPSNDNSPEQNDGRGGLGENLTPPSPGRGEGRPHAGCQAGNGGGRRVSISVVHATLSH